VLEAEVDRLKAQVDGNAGGEGLPDDAPGTPGDAP
jgi:hypothetical protein